MTPSSLANGTSAHPIVVHYHLEGLRCPAAVVRGQSRIVGAAVVADGGAPRIVRTDVSTFLANYGTRPRVYADAILGRTIERVYGIPTPMQFDDVSLMHGLLDRAGLHATPPDSPHADFPVQAVRVWDEFQRLPQRLLSAGLGITYAQIEIPTIAPTVEMIATGIAVDVESLDNLIASTTADLEISQRQIAEIVGQEIDPGDDNRVARLLHRELQLPVQLWQPETRLPSVSQQALSLLGNRHPVLPPLIRHREHRPLVHAARGLRSHIDARTGRVHARLDPLGAATGRFTCCEPNLQGLHRGVRGAIVASPGHVLIEADVSQAEFRVLAHVSRDPTLIEAFASSGVDLHRQTMALARGKSLDQVTDAERQMGKAVNFGIIYGETEVGLAKDLRISETEARDFIDAFFRTRPGVRHWIDSATQQAGQAGDVRTLFGRRRALCGLWSDVPAERRRAERQAINTIIQGTAADLLKLALVRVHRALPPNCRLLLTVHDSVLVEAPIQQAREVAEEVRRQMEMSPPNFAVPIKVDVKIGGSWGGCVPIG